MVTPPLAAVFLDRDGVLSVPEFRDGRSFAAKRFADFHLYGDAVDSVRRLKAGGYAVVVVTNQPDVANGLTVRAEVDSMHRHLAATLPVDRIEVCFHGQSEHCACRKPRPGMLLSAAAALGLDLGRSVMVGDRNSDMGAGRAAGCGTTILIDRGYRDETPQNADHVVVTLSQAADIILAQRINAGRVQDPASRGERA
jgi:D-glycero-D-manno-heptose 1,7-bisphosphate phosphatase